MHPILPDPEHLRSAIAAYLSAGDHFKPEHSALDTANLLQRFDPSQAALLVASRPFSNLNNLFAEREKAQSIVTVIGELEYCSCGNPEACWWNVTKTRVIDGEKMTEIKQTYNSPALLPHLLPPVSHLLGKLGHPALKSGKIEAWKQVAGKLEAISDPLPASFFPEPNPKANLSRKEQREAEAIEVANQAIVDQFVTSTLDRLTLNKGYPGGLAALNERCFSLYSYQPVGDDQRIVWLGDYTHKAKGWGKKKKSVTVPLPPYMIKNGIAYWE